MPSRPDRRAAALAMFALLPFTGTPARADEVEARVYRPAETPQLPPLRVEVLDGRRFRDVETGAIYRLYGIDTCAPGQQAALGRQTWPCGVVATAWLVAATLNRWLSCAVVREAAGERLARCASAAHPDLAAGMIRDGLAVSLPATDHDPVVRAYALGEREARKAYRGLWASTFQMPWDYRAGLARASAAASAGTEPSREDTP